MVIGAHHSRAGAPDLDVLIHPGGIGTRAMTADPAHLEWVLEQSLTARLMMSVCTGSLVYATAGMLHNKPATTHWAAVSELAALDPSIRIDPDTRWVDAHDALNRRSDIGTTRGRCRSSDRGDPTRVRPP
ncbi:DJ-1/PfpI family protein [Angustibacter sp. McL0619]|uniref:DJ-1/PfpI family protein n=1 Tax=Angustibacter sp. McL0619 TaxID=3415676 RepID=UPI003CF8872C